MDKNFNIRMKSRRRHWSTSSALNHMLWICRGRPISRGEQCIVLFSNSHRIWINLLVTLIKVHKAETSQLRRKREIERTQTKCNILCKSTPRIQTGPKKPAWEFRKLRAWQNRKSTNGVGTKKTRNLKQTVKSSIHSRNNKTNKTN